MLKVLTLLLLLYTSLFAQYGVDTVVSDAPSRVQFTLALYTSGGTDYICYALKDQSTPTTLTITAVSNASAGVVSAASHGMHAESSPKVTITGGTGNWTVINSTWQVTYLTADTFSIPLDTTSLGPLTGTLVVKTTAPLLNKPMWLVRKATANTLFYSNGGYSNACTDRATLSYQ